MGHKPWDLPWRRAERRRGKREWRDGVADETASDTISIDDLVALRRKLTDLERQPHTHVKHPEGDRCLDCGAEC